MGCVCLIIPSCLPKTSSIVLFVQPYQCAWEALPVTVFVLRTEKDFEFALRCMHSAKYQYHQAKNSPKKGVCSPEMTSICIFGNPCNRRTASSTDFSYHPLTLCPFSSGENVSHRVSKTCPLSGSGVARKEVFADT